MKLKTIYLMLILAFVIAVAAKIPEPISDDEGFKNLKILPKDISEKSLDSVMHHFSISLGVRCNFCHVQNTDSTGKPFDNAQGKHMDFASDSKEEKRRAREMFQMTSYINANFFNEMHSDKVDTIHEVVCYSCHRGSTQPDAEIFLSIIDSTEKAREAQRSRQPGK